MAQRVWLSSYPEGVPFDIDASAYRSLSDLIDEGLRSYGSRVGFSLMGKNFLYADIHRWSTHFAAYLQSLGLARGDRVAIMMPNVPQYPVVVAAILRAGYVVVNVNPLYTARELEHQLKDSSSKAIVVIENFAHTLQKCIAATPVQHVVLCSMGDCMGIVQGALINFVVRTVKRLVPSYHLPTAVFFKAALRRGARALFQAVDIKPEDIAVLQYTGGTTGVSKGAMLSHRNLVANTLQSVAWFEPAMKKIPQHEQPTQVCALPLYHIFAFTVCMLLSLRIGAKLILIPNPRDLPSVLKELRKHTIHSFPAVNSLFKGLVNHPDFSTVDWSHLTVTMGGGSAVQSTVAQLWLEKTGCPVCEGYGLSETSPVAIANPVTATQYNACIGLPISSTFVKLLDDNGNEVPVGQAGEIAIQGPQVMQGYWKQPEETEKVMCADGYFKSGDIGVMDAQGYFKIVDRKKDMIVVSGFKVYPTEVEEIVTQMPGILEAACIGVPDEKTGEAVKLVLVRKDPRVTESDVRAYCLENLTGYKHPKMIEFRSELPKTPVGKILRRELR